MLNAELKYMNNILTKESLVSRCVRTEWRAVEMASSVDLLDRYANWKGSRCSVSYPYLVNISP